MSKVQMLRAFVNQRLTLAAEEICELFERTIGEYEEQLCGQRKLLDAVLQPEIRLHRAGVELWSVSEGEDPLEHQEWTHRLDQEEPPESPHIKEEQEELWTSQEGEQLPGLEETDEEKPQSSLLHQRPEQARSSDPLDLQPDTDDKSSHSSDTDDSCDWEETGEPLSDLKKKNEGHQQKQNELQRGVKPFNCSVCDKRYHRKNWLRAHMRLHSEGKRFSCSVCQKTFQWRRDVVKHMRIHTGEKPFSCSDCGAKFSQKEALSRHMKNHTGEKPFGCSVCGINFSRKTHLMRHMKIHTGEKPFSCSVCGRRFADRSDLTSHQRVHSERKRFSCSVCKKPFIGEQML